MKKIPWRSVAAFCGTVAILSVGRCAVTAGRFLYYGGIAWQREVMADPWFYIGMVAAAVCVAALLALSERGNRAGKAETEETDGCGE